MSKQVATPKQTGGGGFAFEDLVAAWFLLLTLRGEKPFGDAWGSITRIGFQKRVDGWLLDDLVLDLDGPSSQSKVAISVKSNTQLSSNGFPKEFVSDVWEQLLGGDPFDIGRDLLCLVTAPADGAFRVAWEGLASKAATADEDNFEKRLKTPNYASQMERAFFASLACPSKVAKGKTSADSVRLLRRLRYLDFDFGSQTSHWTASALAKCRDALRSTDGEHGKQLWDRLQLISRDFRVSGGDLSLQALADQLRAEWDLVDYPEHRADWETLHRATNFEIEQVADSLGGATRLKLPQIEVPTDHSILAIVGVSGSGKSAAAKKILLNQDASVSRIWLAPDSLNSASPGTLLSPLGLRFPFLDLVRGSFSQSGILVVDAAEKLNETGLSNLFSIVAAARPAADRSPWKIVFTCTIDRWNSITSQLVTAGDAASQPHTHILSIDFRAHREVVCKAFPHLSALLSRSDIGRLCSNLKILDVLVRHASVNAFGEVPVGETAISDWFWQDVLSRQDDMAASGFAQKLASHEADDFSDGVSVANETFDSGDRQIGARLRTTGVVTCRDERFRFEHDLFGDWARSRFLLSQSDAAGTIIAKAPNPRWHRAIRLHGLRLLESPAQGLAAWLKLLNQLTPDGHCSLQSDLILDSVIFAADATSTMDAVWEQLVADDGELLRRLLNRFLHVATVPDPRLGAIERSSLAASWRIPYWQFWPAVLATIYQRRADAIPAAAALVSDIAHRWLTYAPRNFRWRKEAARLLIECSEHMIQRKQSDGWRFDDVAAKQVFGQVPLAAEEEKNPTIALLRRLAEREDESLFATHEEQQPANQGTDLSATAWLLEDFDQELAGPWEDGPLRDVDSSVADALLSTDNPLTPLFRACPDAAIEVLLALLIREPLPKARPGWLAHDPIDDFVNVSDVRDWSPVMYFRGPFFTWLHENPLRTVDAIIQLVDFATDRWLESQEWPPDEIAVEVGDIARTFKGGLKVWSWHRDWPGTNHAVGSALMALEKWFYDHSEQPEKCGPVISRLLAGSQSVAFLGVLCSVGKHRPDYFREQLRPLVSAWRLMVYDIEYLAQGIDPMHRSGLGMIQWQREGQWAVELAYEWHSLSHRGRRLIEAYAQLMLADEGFQTYLAEVRSSWTDQLSSLEGAREHGLLRSAIAQLDPSNWQASRQGDEILITYIEPADLAQEYAAERQTLSHRMADIHLPYRCRELLENRQRLELSQIEELWRQVHRIADEYRKGDGEELWKLADRLIGGIAVLEVLHHDWLEEQGERRSWCLEMFDLIWREPPLSSPFTVPETIGGHGWRNFSAFIIVPEFAANTSDGALRAIIANLAFAYEFSVAGDLMNLAFEHRSQLGEEFVRLQRLIIEVSAVREIYDVTQGGNSVWHTPDSGWNINDHLHDLQERFVSKSMPASRPVLSDVAMSTTRAIFNIVYRACGHAHDDKWSDDTKQKVETRIDRLWGFEAGVIKAGFGWLNRTGEVIDSDDGAVDALEEIIQATLRPLGDSRQAQEDEDDHHSFYSQPDDFGDWVIDTITQLIPYIDDAVKASRLWTPFLALGLNREHWVERFLSSWCIHGLRAEGRTDRFIATWRSMISYAWESESWKSSDRNSLWDREGLFRHLMGFGLGGFLSDDKHLEAITEKMSSQFERWAEEFLYGRESFIAFCELLHRPVRESFLRAGLHWMAESLPKLEDRAWREDGYVSGWIVKLFDGILTESRINLSRDIQSRAHMLSMTRMLVDRQIASAMALQERIAAFHLA